MLTGFEKIKELPSGVQVSWWSAMTIGFDIINGQLHFVLGGWISEEAKDAGKSPVMTENYDFDIVYDGSLINPVELCYSMVQAQQAQSEAQALAALEQAETPAPNPAE